MTLPRERFNRRDFLKFAGISTAAGLISCAINPVTGERQLMLVPEFMELNIDKENSPHQFSADYGVCRDAGLNSYLNEVGESMAALSHRPERPYSFRAVNTPWINAYAFPGGTIAVTRGILVRLEDESQLAGLLGHEIAHVCWRHTAERMSYGVLVSLALLGASAYIESRNRRAGQISAILGAVAAGALLAYYSRSDEREADATGMEYMVRSGYTPWGMVGLMDMLNSLHRVQPSALDLMFATHPMSSERLEDARNRAITQYASAQGGNRNREPYMDSIARLRRMEKALIEMERGREDMAEGRANSANEHFQAALAAAPEDYCAHLMMAECCLERRDLTRGLEHVREAKALEPNEPRANAVAGKIYLERKDFGSAYDEFKTYDARLSGNPNITYWLGYAAEGMRDYRLAARHYLDYLKHDTSSKRAQYAYARLVEWGVIKEEQEEEEEE